MPGLTARICGICPVSHLLASSKAGDRSWPCELPAGGREAAAADEPGPDRPVARAELLPPQRARPAAGHGRPPAKRNIFGLIERDPELARGGIRLRQFGQEIIELAGGKRIHPAWAVPGGVLRAIGAAGAGRNPDVDSGSAGVDERGDLALKPVLDSLPDEIEHMGNFPTLFLATVTPAGGLEYYDGTIRIVDAEGNIVADGLDPLRYCNLPRRSQRGLVLRQVPVLQAPRLPERQVSRRTPRASQRGGVGGHSARRSRNARIQAARQRSRMRVVPLPPRASDRDASLRRAYSGADGRSRNSRVKTSVPKPS